MTVTVLTSLGHGASGDAGVGCLLKDNCPAPPPAEDCAAGSVKVVQGGNLQIGIANAPLAASLALSLSCKGALTGKDFQPNSAQIKWAVTSGGGTVNGLTIYEPSDSVAPGRLPSTSTYLRDGNTSAEWSLGSTVGTQSLTATVNEQNVSFTASALPPNPGGSCTELINTSGTNFVDDRRISGTQTWTLSGSPYRGKKVEFTGARLTIEPGVQVCLQSLVMTSGTLRAEGLATKPVLMTGPEPVGLDVSLSGGQPSGSNLDDDLIQHVRITGLSGLRTSSFGLRIEDSTLTALTSTPNGAFCRSVSLGQSPSLPGQSTTRVQRSTFEGLGGSSTDCSAVSLTSAYVPSAQTGNLPAFSGRVLRSRGIGLQLTPLSGPWTLNQCEITGSGSHGVLAATEGLTASNCSFFGNLGNAIENPKPAAYTVNAKGNWWGDPSGPNGAFGNRVSAGVDASLPQATPPLLGY
jgi:hypothetical protein